MSSFLNQTPQNFRVLFLDMDSFFASCEQQANPKLRGQAVGVVPQLIDSTCVLSASYEAKWLGVKTGTSVREARAKIPQMIFVEARPRYYKSIHWQLADILSHFSPWVEAKSIDEFSMQMALSERNDASAMRLGQAIKHRFRQEIGEYITASIGFGPNQFLAKVAGELNKPNGFGVITLQNLDAVLGGLSMTDLPGIARGLSRRLQAHGIHTTSTLLNADTAKLRRILGFLGEVWWYRLHGWEVDDYALKRSTIGHSHVLPPVWRTYDRAWQVLQKLTHKAGQRLRREGYFATHTSLSIQYMGHQHFFDHTRSMPYSDTANALTISRRLFERQPYRLEPILHLAFSFGGLVKSNARPQSLFINLEKPIRLSEALDKVNDKYGRDTIFNAGMLSAKLTAPDRIPFGKVRY